MPLDVTATWPPPPTLHLPRPGEPELATVEGMPPAPVEHAAGTLHEPPEPAVLGVPPIPTAGVPDIGGYTPWTYWVDTSGVPHASYAGKIDASSFPANITATPLTLTAASGGDSLILDGPYTAGKRITWKTNGVTRWAFGTNQVAETGSNVGSDMILMRMDDNGAPMQSPLVVSRSTGKFLIYNGIQFTGAFAVGANNTDLSGGLALNGTTWGFKVTIGPGRINCTAPAGGGFSWNIGGSEILKAIPQAMVTAGNDTLASTQGFAVNGTAAATRGLFYQTASVNRWQIRVTGAEGGSNAGSDFNIISYTDAGVQSLVPITITRSTGFIVLSTQTTIGGGSNNAIVIVPGAAGTNFAGITPSNSGGLLLGASGRPMGFFGTTPAAKPTVSGAKGSNAALASLLAALVALGLVTDTTTA